jgi:hypothetical protein
MPIQPTFCVFFAIVFFSFSRARRDPSAGACRDVRYHSHGGPATSRARMEIAYLGRSVG